MNELIFLLLLFGLPGTIGFFMAKRRKKNPYLWSVLSALFPFFLVVLRMNYKPETKQDPKPQP